MEEATGHGKIDDFVKLIDALNNARGPVLAVVLIAVIAILLFLGWRHHSDKKAKNARSKAYNDTLTNLANVVGQVAPALAPIPGELSRVTTGLNQLISRTEGTMNSEDSFKLLEHQVRVDAYREICKIVQQSILENDFAKRKAYVELRVKNAITDVMRECRSYLGSFNLSSDVQESLRNIDLTGSPCLLSCLVWDKVSPIYLKLLDPLDKYEEAFQVIELVMQDYYALILKPAGTAIRTMRPEPRQSEVIARRTTRLLTETSIG